jgi:hypothetical protein
MAGTPREPRQDPPANRSPGMKLGNRGRNLQTLTPAALPLAGSIQAAARQSLLPVPPTWRKLVPPVPSGGLARAKTSPGATRIRAGFASVVRDSGALTGSFLPWDTCLGNSGMCYITLWSS